MPTDSTSMDGELNQGTVDTNSPVFSESGKNEVKAITSASQALQIATKLDWNDRDRDIRRSRVLSAFNGSAPFCEKELVNQGQAYRYNVSFGFLEGVIGRAVVPYNELTINVSDLTEIEANLPDNKVAIVQDEFGKIMKKWGKWAKFVTRLNQDLVLNGYNNAIFPSDYDPFPVFVPQKNGFVDEGAPNEVLDLELFVWKKSYLLHELYAKIADPEVAKKAGWNVDNVRDALTMAAPEDIAQRNMTGSGTWTAVESAIRGGSLFASMVGAKMVDTFHVFAAELDGKVTHWIVLNQGNKLNNEKSKDGTSKDGPELFRKEGRFDSMRDFLVYFDLETGDGTWHGSRGVGQRTFNTHKAIDRLRNSVLDQAFVSGLTLLQPGDQTSQEDMTLMVVGPFAVIPQGIAVNTTVLPAVSATTFQVDALLAGTSEQRIGDVVPQAQSLPDTTQTATEARLKAGRSELITRGNLKRYVDPISQVMSIIVRRLLKANSPNAYAKEFQAELKRKGLTEEDLKEIRGARNTGRIEDILGNTAQGTQIIFAEFRGDPMIDQENLSRRRIASVLDPDAAEELIITDKDQTRLIEAQRQQELENTTIESGVQVPVSPRDNHEAHLKVVLESIGADIQRQSQGINPQSVPMLKRKIEHGGGHLKYLQADKAKHAAFEDGKKRLQLAIDTVKKIEKKAFETANEAADQALKMAQTPEQKAQAEAMKAQIEQQKEAA